MDELKKNSGRGCLLFVHTVAERLNCSKQYVYNLIENGRLQIIRLGPRGIRVSEFELEEFIRNGEKNLDNEY